MLEIISRYFFLFSTEQDYLWLLAAFIWAILGLLWWGEKNPWAVFALMRTLYLGGNAVLTTWAPTAHNEVLLWSVRIWQLAELLVLRSVCSPDRPQWLLVIVGSIAVVGSTIASVPWTPLVPLLGYACAGAVVLARRPGDFSLKNRTILLCSVVLVPALDRFGMLNDPRISVLGDHAVFELGVVSAAISLVAGLHFLLSKLRVQAADLGERFAIRWIQILVIWLVLGGALVIGEGQIARRDYARGVMLRVQTAALRLNRADTQAVLDSNLHVGALRTRVVPHLAPIKIAKWPAVGTSAYVRLRADLAELKTANPDAKFVYVITYRDGLALIVAAADAAEEATGEVNVYDSEPPNALLRFRDRREPIFDSPMRDNWGDLVSASAPLLDPKTHELLGWLAMDFPLSEYLASAGPLRWTTIAFTLIGFVLGIFIFRHQYEQVGYARLQSAALKAQESEQIKTELLATLSHDVRTPLQSVLSYAQLIESTPLDQAQRRFLEALREQADGLLHLLQNLLHLGSAELAHTPNVGTFSPHRLCNELTETFAGLAKKKHLTFTAEIDASVPQLVVGDEIRLRQILLNLLANAVKYTDRGSVSLNISLAAPSQPEVVSCQLAFVVNDTGPGIAAEIQKGLFALKIGQPGVLSRDGVGLGLPLVGRLCRMLGGTVDVQSAVNAGSRFEVRLPFNRAQAAAPQESAREISQARPGNRIRKILLVEDHRVVREALREVLSRLGFIVSTAETAAEAMSLVTIQRFDAALLDLGLPDENGLELCRRIRKRDTDPSTPPLWLIAITAAPGDEIQQAVATAGFDRYLAKPVAAETLFEALTSPNAGEKNPMSFDEQLSRTPRDALAHEAEVAWRNLSQAFTSRNGTSATHWAHHLRNTALLLKDEKMEHLTEHIETALASPLFDWPSADRAKQELDQTIRNLAQDELR